MYAVKNMKVNAFTMFGLGGTLDFARNSFEFNTPLFIVIYMYTF